MSEDTTKPSPTPAQMAAANELIDPFIYGGDRGLWKAVAALIAERDAARAERDAEWDASDLAELHRMIPDLNAMLTHNPLAPVMFRAGLLACRETMARFVEQGGSDVEKSIAQSIRANWWPSLGEDPGPPRQLRYDEIADEKPDGHIDHKPMSPSVEALPRAFAFLAAPPSPEPAKENA